MLSLTVPVAHTFLFCIVCVRWFCFHLVAGPLLFLFVCLSRLDYSYTNSLRWPHYLLLDLKTFNSKIVGNIHFGIIYYFPDPLLSSRSRLAVWVSSHVVSSCSVLPIALYLATTRFTFVADVHTVSVCPAVSSHVSEVFPVHPLGICLAPPIHRQPRPPGVSCSCLLDLPDQGGNGFGEVGDGLALRHHCLSIFCRSRCKFDEGIVLPIYLFYVVCSVVSPRTSQ